MLIQIISQIISFDCVYFSDLKLAENEGGFKQSKMQRKNLITPGLT